jgi:putative polyhydroxyalkanoate system protein
MRSIRVHKSHALSLAEVRRRVERAAQRAEERYRVAWRWVDDGLEVFPPPGMARGAQGRLRLSEGAVQAEVVLPFAMQMLKGTIESRLADKLDELLAC